MSLRNWLQSEYRNPCEFNFDVFDISEQYEYNDEVVALLANLIVTAHGNPRMIVDDCKKLIEDAKHAKLDIVGEFVTDQLLSNFAETEKQILQSYLENEILPNGKNKQVLITKIGHFGEIVAAQYLIEFDEYWLPIYKLQYREKKNWAQKLTDLCLIKTQPDERPLVCYCEVKTHSSKVNKNLGIEGHNSLIRDDALKNPEILRFISQRLYDAGRYDEASFISDMKLSRIVYDKKHELFLVHELSEWDEEVLTRLAEHGLESGLIGFCVRVTVVNNLRMLIDAVYANSWAAAKALLDE